MGFISEYVTLYRNGLINPSGDFVVKILKERELIGRKIMGIQKTNLDEYMIKNLMDKYYGINGIEIEKNDRGTANIFKITSKGKQYILKEFSEGRTEESVIKESNVINFLKEKKIKVPIYVKTKSGNLFIKVKKRIIVLQKYIDGYTMDNNTGDYKKTIESAKILGKIVKALAEYKELDDNEIIKNIFSKESLENGIIKIENLKNNLKLDNPYRKLFEKDLQDKIDISKELINNFDFSILKKLTIMNSHGDYSVQQLIYNDKKGTTVIDFETAKKLPIIWEIMRSYSYIDKEAKDGELNINTLVDYIKEFSKYVQLNEYDIKYAAQLYLIQIVSSTFGYKQYNDDFEKDKLLEFAFFRTNLCRYLYKNYKEISLKLQNEIKNYTKE